mmetsp:Transcript_39133/g.80149  ORF Transcript_39133/g.80149 Transcript_39133/m.80149 type:complete len:282 (+) Transcript_39133:426-1271(+)
MLPPRNQRTPDVPPIACVRFADLHIDPTGSLGQVALVERWRLPDERRSGGRAADNQDEARAALGNGGRKEDAGVVGCVMEGDIDELPFRAACLHEVVLNLHPLCELDVARVVQVRLSQPCQRLRETKVASSVCCLVVKVSFYHQLLKVSHVIHPLVTLPHLRPALSHPSQPLAEASFLLSPLPDKLMRPHVRPTTLSFDPRFHNPHLAISDRRQWKLPLPLLVNYHSFCSVVICDGAIGYIEVVRKCCKLQNRSPQDGCMQALLVQAVMLRDRHRAESVAA